jgi:hypothetical protein
LGFALVRRWGFALAARRTFFCFAKRKYAKKRRPGVSACCAGFLRYSVFAGAAELGPTGLRQSSRYFREALRCSALSTGRENRRTPKLLTLNNVWKSEPLVVP